MPYDRPAEKRALISWLDSDSYAIGVHDLAAYVNCELYGAIEFVFNVGDMAAGATMDVDIEVASDAAGTGAATVKSMTQLTQAGGDSNAKVSITCSAIELEEALAGGGFINAEVTIAAAAVEFGLMVYGWYPRYLPAGETNWTEVRDPSDS